MTKAGPGVFFYFFKSQNYKPKLWENMKKKICQNTEKKNPEKYCQEERGDND